MPRQCPSCILSQIRIPQNPCSNYSSDRFGKPQQSSGFLRANGLDICFGGTFTRKTSLPQGLTSKRPCSIAHVQQALNSYKRSFKVRSEFRCCSHSTKLSATVTVTQSAVFSLKYWRRYPIVALYFSRVRPYGDGASSDDNRGCYSQHAIASFDVSIEFDVGLV
jgi:hypothetical protein